MSIQAASSFRGNLEVKGLSDAMAICKSSLVMSENHHGKKQRLQSGENTGNILTWSLPVDMSRSRE